MVQIVPTQTEPILDPILEAIALIYTPQMATQYRAAKRVRRGYILLYTAL